MGRIQGKSGQTTVVSIRISEADRAGLLGKAAEADVTSLSDYVRLLIVNDIRGLPDERLLIAFAHLLRAAQSAIALEADPVVRTALDEICRDACSALRHGSSR